MPDSNVPSPSPQQLHADLQRKLLEALHREYADINATYLRRALTQAVLTLSSSTTYLGRWSPDGRIIEISLTLVQEHSWGDLLDVLKHEMAHQYVDEVLGGEQHPHGPAFRQTCKYLGISPRATGLAKGSGSTSARDDIDTVLQKVAKLLTLAESPNQHEAQAAMRAAQRLMLRYNLERLPDMNRIGYGTRQVGRVTGRTQEWERRLSGILSKHFFVECIWAASYVPREGKWKRVLEISGTEANLEMASYVHSFLSQTAEQLWREHKRAHGITANRDRQAYLAGVMAGFTEKLAQQQQSFQEQGLVWRGDPKLDEYVHRRYPRIRTRALYGRPDNDARRRGQQAGRRLVIHRPVSQGSGRASGRLLAGGGGD